MLYIADIQDIGKLGVDDGIHETGEIGGVIGEIAGGVGELVDNKTLEFGVIGDSGEKCKTPEE